MNCDEIVADPVRCAPGCLEDREPALPATPPRPLRGDDLDEMIVDALADHGVGDPAIARAVAAVTRARRVPVVGPQPHEVARTLLALRVQPGDRVLATGTGCAYTVAVLAAYGAEVCIVEEERADAIIGLLAHLGLDAEVVTGDPGRGLPGRGPFDAILVGARPGLIPDELLDQLAVSGTLVLLEGGERAPGGAG
jgi:protein-L-isoaspartate O-methyltransferase